MSGRRLRDGGRIDRARAITFRFDGQAMTGHEGDTLASALLANGVEIVARSFKYHRPRGLMAAGIEEANGFVRVGTGDHAEPCVAATEVPLYEGLEARSLNAWPNVRHDVLGLFDRGAALLPSGFYYKTFLWPNWHLFEGAIRRAAGLGHAPTERDRDRYRHRKAQCDVLVVGGGAAGMAAAADAAAAGKRVILAETTRELGGRALWAGDAAAARVAEDAAAALRANPNVRVLTGTTVFGSYDHGLFGAVERRVGAGLAQVMWKIRAGETVVATGAFERPLLFPGNDVPGVMLASAVHEYALRYGVAAGTRAVVVTNNDGGEATAAALRAAGIEVVAMLDTRGGDAILGVTGRKRVRGVKTNRGTIACDLVAMSGGWSPAVHLFSQAGGTLRFCEERRMMVPDTAPANVRCVGGAAGECGGPTGRAVFTGNGKAFVDLASDVTVGGVALAAQENYASVEHLKRYTTLGMGPDQGRTSNVNGLMLLGEATGRVPGAVGTTRFRPPFSPIRFGAVAGVRTDELLRPRRYLPAHDWHVAQGAAFEDYGWQRPDAYLRPGETIETAAAREAKAVRDGVGLFDASPLGKIEVRGRDAARLLDFAYVGTMSTLAPGKVRYGLMLNEHGIIMDDGVCVRLGEDHFLVHATSGNADRIAAWLDEWLQCEFIDYDATVVNVTTQWATATLSGPRARDVLAALDPGIDLSGEAFPHMAFREGAFGGVPTRIARVSFTGEASYEISVPARYATALFEAAAAVPGVVPYGIEAVERLRIEKGYIHVGADTDGTSVPADIGMGAAIARKASDFAGRRSLSLPGMSGADRLQLVGLETASLLAPGAHIKAADGRSEGHVTSACHAPTLGRPIALAMIKRGRERIGEAVTVYDLGRETPARIVAPVFYDAAGERLHG